MAGVERDRVVARRRYIAPHAAQVRPRPGAEELFSAHRREGGLDTPVRYPELPHDLLRVGAPDNRQLLLSIHFAVPSSRKPTVECAAADDDGTAAVAEFFAWLLSGLALGARILRS